MIPKYKFDYLHLIFMKYLVLITNCIHSSLQNHFAIKHIEYPTN